MHLDADHCYRAVQSRDARFDGWFVIAVTSTRIYCRPSCPAITPKRANARFYGTAAAAQRAGFRACKRCRPDASPGSPEWNGRSDLVGRAMRLIADGVVDRDGVGGVADRLAVSERQLHRVLTMEVGAGPLALARAQRAQTARILVETTDLPVTQVAFAAGFASVRQFNDTIRDVFASTPTELRRASRHRPGATSPGALILRLACRPPFAGQQLLDFLAVRAVPGIEVVADGSYRRSLGLVHGAGTVELRPAADHVGCTLRLEDLRDLTTAVQRCRRLLDLDADPVAVDTALGDDELLAPLVARTPGLRAPGHVDGAELAVRAVLGQQISVAGARTQTARLVQALGAPLDGTLRDDAGTITHRFPAAATIAGASDADLPMPASRRAALRRLTGALADGTIVVDAGADRHELTAQLVALPGIGPWTAAYIALRGTGDPDTFLATDLGVRHALESLGRAGDPAAATARSQAWRPWRAYALHHLWTSLAQPRALAPAGAPSHPTHRSA